MKPFSERSTAKAKKAPARTAAAVQAKDRLDVGMQAVQGKKAVKAKSAPAMKRERHTHGVQGRGHVGDNDFWVALQGASVTAHDVVTRGVPGRTLTRIWETAAGGLPLNAILKAIGVSERTAHRIKSDPDKPLDPRTTDGIYRLESVRALAEEVLGSPASANEWLNTEAIGLEFRKPIDLLSTSPGAEAVKTLLQRMKYGVYA